MRTKTILLIGVLSLLLSSCIGHHRYESRGTVTMSFGEADALMYWYGDDGLLWYGKPYKDVDSGLEMNICGATSKNFVPASETNHKLQLPNKGGDLQVAKVDNSGHVVRLSEPKRMPAGTSCGHIEVGETMVSIEGLSAGAEPEVIILCKNKQKPDRYPHIDRYEFEPVTKKNLSRSWFETIKTLLKREASELREPPSPCPATNL